MRSGMIAGRLSRVFTAMTRSTTPMRSASRAIRRAVDPVDLAAQVLEPPPQAVSAHAGSYSAHQACGRGRGPAASSITAPSENSVSSSKGAADELQAERQALADEAGRHGDAGQAGHVHRHGEDVVEIHLDRIVAEPFSPMPKAADGVAGVRMASTPAA